MALPGSRFDSEERGTSRDTDRFTPTWPPRHNDYLDREPENGRDRSLEKSREPAEPYTILQKTLMQHKQNQQQRDQASHALPHHTLPHVLSFQLSQKQSQGGPLSFPPQVSPNYLNTHPTSITDSYDRMDIKDSKDSKNSIHKDLTDDDHRSRENHKASSVSPTDDKNQFSPPSDGKLKRFVQNNYIVPESIAHL